MSPTPQKPPSAIDKMDMLRPLLDHQAIKNSRPLPFSIVLQKSKILDLQSRGTDSKLWPEMSEDGEASRDDLRSGGSSAASQVGVHRPRGGSSYTASSFLEEYPSLERL